MNLLKSVYVSSFLTAAMALSGYAGWQLWQAGTLASPWTGALLAGGAPSVFFMRLFLLPVARTGDRLWGVLAVTVVGTGIAAALGGGTALWLAAVVGVIGTLLYDNWFSRFGGRSTAILAPGKSLPAFTLQDADGNTHSSGSLTRQPTIWMFYRGNWCPFCMAQIREVAAQYRELEQRGAHVILISPQSEAHTRSLAKKFDVPMQFLIDVDNQAARTLDVFAENGLPTGMQALGYDSDVPLPTVFITDAGGKILYADLTENYRIRPEPAEFLRVLDGAAA
jgi:peroxiredoxin